MKDRILSFKLLWFLFSIELLTVFFLSLNKYFDNDEIESMHAAWKIFSGQRIYMDFFEHHHPFFYYMLVPFVGMFNENAMVMIAGRVLVFLMLLLIFLVTYLMARDLFEGVTALISVVLLSATHVFIFKAIEIRPDVPQTLFELVAVFLLFKYFKRYSLACLILSAISFGISFLFLQKSIFLVFMAGVILIFSDYINQIKLKDAFIFSIVFIGTLLPFYLYLVLTGQIQAYWVDNWAMNAAFIQDRFSQGASHWEWATTTLLSDLKQNPLLWVFWMAGLFFLDSVNRKRAGAISLFLLISFILVPIHFEQYLLPLMPLMAIIAGHAMLQIGRLLFKKNLSWVIVIIYVFYPLNSIWEHIKCTPNSDQMKEMSYALSVTKPTDFVYDPDRNFHIFRNNMDWQNVGVQSWFKNRSGYHFNVYTLIDKFKPKIISHTAGDMSNSSIAKHYKMSDKFPDLFIRIN